MLRFILSFVLLLSLSCSAFSEGLIQSQTIPGVKTVYKIHTEKGVIYSASQPSQQSFQAIKTLPVKTIVNLRVPSEMQFDEKKIVTDLGMKYILVPINISHFNAKTIGQFNKILANPKNYPLFVHCRSANRTAMMLVFHDITVMSVPVDRAVQDGREIGLTNNSLKMLIKRVAKQINMNANHKMSE